MAGSPYQAAVLSLLDDADGPLTVGEIAERLGLASAQLRPHIATMLLHKTYTLLAKVDNEGEALAAGKGLGDADRLALNVAFQHTKRKFKLPTAVAPSGGAAADRAVSGGEPAAVSADVAAQRRNAIDACVVRVMKSRRTLPFHALQAAVVEQLAKDFPAQPRMIKARVEELVEREFLTRADDDPTRFVYLA